MQQNLHGYTNLMSEPVLKLLHAFIHKCYKSEFNKQWSMQKVETIDIVPEFFPVLSRSIKHSLSQYATFTT